MNFAWTGGQYSIVRAITGIALFVYFVSRLDLASFFAIAAVFFIVGWFDRIAAIAMWCAIAWLHWREPLMLQSAVLLIHACLPPAPFLSIAARGRVDPRGNWSFPRAWIATAWIVMLLGWVAVFFTREFHWLAIVFHLFLFHPKWIAGRDPGTTDDVFYDGTCGLCHKGMRWLVAEDPTGTSFRYAPLGGDAFNAAFPDASNLPDSVIVKTSRGEVFVRSDAATHLLGRIGGLWRIAGAIYGALPRGLRDGMYDFVARVRYRVFGRTKDACPVVPPDLRGRFTF